MGGSMGGAWGCECVGRVWRHTNQLCRSAAAWAGTDQLRRSHPPTHQPAHPQAKIDPAGTDIGTVNNILGLVFTMTVFLGMFNCMTVQPVRWHCTPVCLPGVALRSCRGGVKQAPPAGAVLPMQCAGQPQTPAPCAPSR